MSGGAWAGLLAAFLAYAEVSLSGKPPPLRALGWVILLLALDFASGFLAYAVVRAVFLA